MSLSHQFALLERDHGSDRSINSSSRSFSGAHNSVGSNGPGSDTLGAASRQSSKALVFAENSDSGPLTRFFRASADRTPHITLDWPTLPLQIGRDKALQELSKAVIDERGPFVCLHGKAGVGKTTLLRAIVQ